MANNENNVAAEENLQVVAFKLRNEEYGVSILNVQEIRNLTDITRVPFAQDFIKGVINLRGSVLPVIDLKERLGLEETPYTQDTRIVTVHPTDEKIYGNDYEYGNHNFYHRTHGFIFLVHCNTSAVRRSVLWRNASPNFFASTARPSARFGCRLSML